MASVDKDSSRKKTPYVVRWRDEAGRQRKRGFTRKLDADRFRAEVEHQLHTGTYVDHLGGRRTFRTYAEAWRQAQPHAPNTARDTGYRLERHIYPVIGNRPLSMVRTTELQALVTGLPLAPSSVRPVWSTVTAIFNAAVRDRLIGRTPCEGVVLPVLQAGKVEPLTREQVNALIQAVPERYKALVLLDAGTGLRQGEVFGLCLRDDDGPVVDLARRSLRVARQIQPRPGGIPEVCRLKNRNSYRTLPLADVIVDSVVRHLEAFPPSEVEVNDGTDRTRPVRRGFLLLFTDDAGRPLQRHRFNHHVWRPSCGRAAEILRKWAADEHEEERAEGLRRQADAMWGVGQHDLRHFFASALIRAGLNVKVVAERLGHANATMTLNVYAHLWPDDADRTRQAVEDAFKIGLE